MKKLLYIFLGLSLIFGCSDDSDVNSPDPDSPVYLDDNGVTIKAKDWAVLGDSGSINGITYTIVDRQTLENMIRSGEDVTNVCTSLISNMQSMISGSQLPVNTGGEITYLDFNQDISSWDVSNVTNMKYMFKWSNFDHDISHWDVGNVSSMQDMFKDNFNFNQDLGNWDVSNVIDFSKMFENAHNFNQDLGNWDVSSAEFMTNMFTLTEFNQDIGNWDVSNVLIMSTMFADTPFNQDISSWDVSNVQNMSAMFAFNEEFNQDLSNWSVENVTNCSIFNVQINQQVSPWTLPQPNFTNCNPD